MCVFNLFWNMHVWKRGRWRGEKWCFAGHWNIRYMTMNWKTRGENWTRSVGDSSLLLFPQLTSVGERGLLTLTGMPHNDLCFWHTHYYCCPRLTGVKERMLSVTRMFVNDCCVFDKLVIFVASNWLCQGKKVQNIQKVPLFLIEQYKTACKLLR